MITRIGSASANAATVTIPAGHGVGDLIVIHAFRDGSVTNPSIPAGWTKVTNTSDGTLCSISIGYRYATSNSMTSGTWTNATNLICLVYRGTKSSAPFGTGTHTAETTSTCTYGARALAASGVTGSSWFIAFAAHVNVDTDLETAPTNMTFIVGQTNATAESAAFDTNGVALGNWPSTARTLSGTAGAHQTYVLELKADSEMRLNNFHSLTNTTNSTGANAGVLSFSERVK